MVSVVIFFFLLLATCLRTLNICELVVDDTVTTMEEEEEPLVQPHASMCIDSPPPEKRAPLEELCLPSAKRLRAYY